ncbi:MAG: DUF4159 domain-containing protein [Alphaproteobacteria bacterium]
MFTLGSLTFLSPLLLAAVAAIPVIWWLLRVMPPRPRNVKFPGFFLLQGLSTDVKTASHTPWWLLLLRSIIVLFFILALADPVMKLSAGLPGKDGTVLVAIDNGWASAANWTDRADKLQEYIALAKRASRPVILLPTAADAMDGKVHTYGPMDADEAKEWAEHLKPMPWPTSPAEALVPAKEAVEHQNVTYSVYLNDGITPDQKSSDALMALLQSGGGLTFVTDEKINTPYILRKKPAKPGELEFTLERLVAKSAEETLVLSAFAGEGNALDNLSVTFPAGKTTTDIKWELMSEMRNEVSRIALLHPQMASASYVTDSQWRQHPVGIVTDTTHKESASFLNEVYYLKRALQANGLPEMENLATLISKPLSAVIMPDTAAMTAGETAQLGEWVRNGGFLIRFAGPNLAANPDDPLVPVPLRYGQRSMEGAMTWEKPVKLGSIPQESPLNGLNVPKDATVTRQVLSNPGPETFDRTWLTLEDGTPLISGGTVGKGVIALIHTTAGPDWSDFCYTGLYVEALQRMISLSTGIGDYKAEAILPPLMLMDGFGKLNPPDRKSVAAAVDPQKDFTPSPATPPGLYGDQRQFRVFNLGDNLSQMKALTGVPATAATETYALSGERSLRENFLKAALLLLLLETILTLWLRGAFPARASSATAAIVICLALFSSPAMAQGQVQPATEADLSSGIYLAYVITGDPDTDALSYNGLRGLMMEINRRSTIKVKWVQGVDLVSDPLYYYPFLYWPMTGGQGGLSPEAARQVQNYLGQGGMIMFDTRDQQFAGPGGQVKGGASVGTRKLREITRNIRIPELMTVAPGHIFTRSFYLLNTFPGLYSGGQMWVEKEPSLSHDSVTSVIIGGNDWAAAWSREPSDRSRFLVQGGERQREMAYRTGVNIVMAALAGSYKLDQMHLNHILERLRGR